MYCVCGSGMSIGTHQSLPQAQPGSAHAAPRVLFIAGMTRSGTTLLDSVLNELPGFVGAGEVRSYWRAMREPRMCGCGAVVSECPFWSEVGAWIERHGGPLPVDRARFLQRAHVRSLPVQLARLTRATEDHSSPGAEYAQLTARLYAGIAAVSGAEVVVDSSKGPHDAYAVSKFTDLDLFVIHLVRDPRGVAYSWSRRAWNPDKPTGRDEERQASEVGIRWVTRNALTEILLARRLGPRYMRIRYEDFVRDPAETIGRMATMCSARWLPLPVSGDVISFGQNHSVSGNPSRLATGPVRIRPDQEWTDRMARPAMVAATIGAAPLLRRYGYPLRPKP
jgi:sulfotransferase family protein